MPTIQCPDCRTTIALPTGVGSGDLVDCPNCAGHALRVHEQSNRWSATLAHRVSCPDCDQALTLPEDARAGDTLACCGRAYRLTFEHGAFAAERAQERKCGAIAGSRSA